MLHRLLVDMRGADYGEDAAAGRQRHRAADAGAGGLDGVHDLLGRLVQDLMVEGFELDADLLLHDYSTIPVTTPAPTRRPPSRLAERPAPSPARSLPSPPPAAVPRCSPPPPPRPASCGPSPAPSPPSAAPPAAARRSLPLPPPSPSPAPPGPRPPSPAP